MKNIEEKYGRQKEFPTLIDAIPVIGWRRVNKEVYNTAPHCFPHYQLIAIIDGHANYWSRNKIYSVNPGEMVLCKPFQIVGPINNTMSKTERCFIQLNTSLLQSLKYVKPDVAVEDLFPAFDDLQVMESGQIPELIKKIITEHREPKENSKLLCEMYFVEILVEIKRLSETKEVSEKRGIQKLVDDYIDDHIAQKISTSDLAQLCGYSPSYFRNLLIETTGMSPNKYVQHRKYLKSCEFLEATDMSIFEIAMELGFSSSQYFATTFKSITSITPVEFREFYGKVMSSEGVPLKFKEESVLKSSKHFVAGQWY